MNSRHCLIVLLGLIFSAPLAAQETTAPRVRFPKLVNFEFELGFAFALAEGDGGRFYGSRFYGSRAD